MRAYSFLILLSSLGLAACGSENSDDDSTPPDSTPSDSSSTNDSGDKPVEPTACETLQLEARPFQEAEDDHSLGALAGDFEVNTTEGTFRLSESWTGCETYLLIQDEPTQATGWPRALWDRDVGDLLKNLPDNTHVLFFSTANNINTREEILSSLENKITKAMKNWEDDEKEWRKDRIQYVTSKIRNLEQWPGIALRNPGWGIGIDRFQRIRYIGSYADPTRYNSEKGWFEPNLSMAANEAIYYNFEAEREARLATQNADIFPVWEGETIGCGWSGRCTTTSVELPDATQMATYDTLELDITTACVGDGEYGDCPPWDYLVYLYLCEDENPESCPVEFGRWITTYHREGRWVHDVSSLLPYLQDGGTKYFSFETVQNYEIDLSLRLFNSEKEVKASSLTPLFNGGGFHSTSNDAYTPIELPIPETAKKVELAYVISGHGMAEPGNCAEFCITDHLFGVNSNENLVSLTDAGVQYGCQEQVSEGTVPNQYGTWWYGRSNWCPGREVQLKTIDVTDQVELGENATFTYTGSFNGAPYPSGGASMRLKSWLVISE